ncbi:PrgI family protein [Clostridioides difficile]|uniref:PrgI family protein n=1 Tax=Clostridioides difficile TaxID=1496 RepID=UPI00202DC438|nr:PrgI family protein [Clostridioides difficile]MCM0747113.1 PrgI family protein [Clostridioides difficile]
MEVKINKEIRNYTESMFFGLSMRQFLFSVLACGVAVGLFFLLRGRFGTETVSWMCVLGASPFAVMGFVRYNGMTAEQFVWAWIKSEFLMPKRVLFVPENLYYEAMKNAMEAREKGTPAMPEKRKKKKRRAKRRKAARKRRKQAEKARKQSEKMRKQNRKAGKRKEADYD